jgi:hypothetical protein
MPGGTVITKTRSLDRSDNLLLTPGQRPAGMHRLLQSCHHHFMMFAWEKRFPLPLNLVVLSPLMFLLRRRLAILVSTDSKHVL